MGAVNGMWLHGADPLTFLHAERYIQELKDKFADNPRLFSDLIRRKLLENTHRLLLVVGPDREIQKRNDAEFAEKMKKLKASLAPAKLEEISKNQAGIGGIAERAKFTGGARIPAAASRARSAAQTQTHSDKHRETSRAAACC